MPRILKNSFIIEAEDKIKNNMASSLKKLREVKGISPIQIAKLMGVTRAQFNRYENACSSMTVERYLFLKYLIENFDKVKDKIERNYHYGK